MYYFYVLHEIKGSLPILVAMDNKITTVIPLGLNYIEFSYLYFSVDDITSNLILCFISCSIRDVLPNAAPGVNTPPL